MAKATGKTTMIEGADDADTRIVIAQRGWVFVGDYDHTDRSVILSNAKTVRNWGTEHGLGQLEGGPLSGTVLDMAGTVRLHPLQVIATIDVDAQAWKAPLKKGKNPRPRKEGAPDTRIVIVQRGWVFVANYEETDKGVVLSGTGYAGTVDDAYKGGPKTIRNWGTEHGLGQLIDGPLSGTVLDLAGPRVRLHPLQVIATIDVDWEPWAKHLATRNA